MTVRMNSSFVDYSDFLDILIEAFNTAPKELFEKIIKMIISTLNKQRVELKKQTLQTNKMRLIPIEDLEKYYSTIVDELKNIKLLKKRVMGFKDKDILFITLYTTMDNLYQALILHIDMLEELDILKLKEKPQYKFAKFAGIWKDRDITKESIKEQAWK